MLQYYTNMDSYIKLVFLCFSVCLLPHVVPKRIPSSAPRCKMNDKNLNECLKKIAMVARPYLAKGLPDYNIPSIEPLVVPMVMLEQGTQAVNYMAKLKNIKVYGLSTYDIREVKADLGKKKVNGVVHADMIRLISDYNIKGRALVVPIEGNGVFMANLTNVKANVAIDGFLVKRKGKDYLDVKDVRVRLTIGNAKANFDNLFNGDKTLSETTNNFLNENAKDLVDEIKPAIEAVVAMLVEDILKKVAKTTPYNELFLPS